MTMIAIPKETSDKETRVAMIPAIAKKLVHAGAEVVVESGLGAACGFADDEYREAGVRVSEDCKTLLAEADIVLRIHRPTAEEVALLKQGALHVSYLDPFNEKKTVAAFQKQQVTAISVEMIPRSTRAQKLDALSSQASLAGYVMVMQAANRLNRILPMMMTPAGTIKPARVFILGAGVAGLQAIATAKRLGARVTAFDTRAVVAEEVESLGAKFLKIDLGETGQTVDGYAQELTPEQLETQKQAQAAEIAQSDVVITTAQVFGRKPPVLVTRAVLSQMQPGSVVVDMAAETGGNVEGSVAGQETVIDGVIVIGSGNWAGQVSRDASAMYASNLFNLIDEFWSEEKKQIELDLEDDILSGCVITHAGSIVNETIKNHYA